MRLALLADIHGNFEALRSVLGDIRRVGADRIVCLGDTVGYGPEPGACLDLIGEWADAEVLGNHDLAAMTPGLERSFAERARVSLEHTRDLLRARHVERLSRIPERDEMFGVGLSHASFSGRFEYLYDRMAASRSLGAMGTAIGAVGHTHLPSMFVAHEDDVLGALSSGGGVDPERVTASRIDHDRAIRLPSRSRVIVNPGSVGQPRDRNPLASWGLLDLDRRVFSVRRVSYDINEVNLKLAALGLPEFLGERLRVGV
ncbi:MAG: metallophosphoesterase family protein [Phycisphaerales bacterium]